MTGHLLIRADASSKTGTGHLMRSFALAQANLARGGQVVFVSHCESQALRKRVEHAGMGFVPVEKPYPHQDDLETSLKLLEKLSAQQNQRTWLVLDGYHFDPLYHQRIRDAGFPLMVVDDTAHLSRYCADVLVNQNIDAPSLSYRADPNTLLLLGTRYTMLRPEFVSRRKWAHREARKEAHRLLVTLGGSDPDNVTLKVLQALERLTEHNLEVLVAVGYANPNLESLQQAAASSSHRIRVQSHITDMPAVMAWADVAVSSAGSTCWELAFMGLPAVVIVIADNQKGIAAGLDHRGAVVNLGWHEALPEDQIAKTLDGLLASEDRRSAMAANGQELVDGGGVKRVLEAMLADSKALGASGKVARNLWLRPVEPGDCHLLWNWANDPEVRRSSFSTERIEWEDHQRWFSSKLHDPGCRHFIIYAVDVNEPVAQVRFEALDNDFTEAEVHISVAPSQRGRGIGTVALALSCDEVFLGESSLHSLHAYVKLENEASQKAFWKVGFCKLQKTNHSGHPAWHYALGRPSR